MSFIATTPSPAQTADMTKIGRPKIVVTNPIPAAVEAELMAVGDVIQNPTPIPWSNEEFLASARSAHAVIAFMNDRFDHQTLLACPSLQIVAGALRGYDNFDVNAFDAAGVWLTVVPDLLANPTAELAIGLMIAAGRRIIEGDSLVRGRQFTGWISGRYGKSIDGSAVGIIGMGQLGQAIVRHLSGFDCQCSYFDLQQPQLPPATHSPPQFKPLELLLSESDFVVLALPLTPQTHHLINRSALRRMKPGAILVNPARGSLVDESAVADRLQSGLLASYATDVYEMEDRSIPTRPSQIHQGLLNQRASILTPHIGAAIEPIREQIARQAVHSVASFFKGMTPPLGAINKNPRPRHNLA